MQAPFHYFRWVHFPWHAELNGAFTYRVKAVFMDAQDTFTHSAAQEADIVLARETWPGKLNVARTRQRDRCVRRTADGSIPLEK